MRASRGFTLVEVMVALAVVAIALPALLLTLQQQIDGTAYLRDQSMARMVAANKLTEIRLLSRARQSLLLTGEDSGEVEFAQRDWYWRLRTIETELPNFYRMDIEVATVDGPDAPALFTLSAFMNADLGPDAGAPPGA